MFVAGQGVCSGGGWITGRSDTQQLLTVLLTQRSRVIVFVRSVTSAAWSPSRVRGGTVGTVRRTTRSTSAPAAPTCETFLLRHQIRKGQKRSMANVIKSHVESNECPPQDVVSIPQNGKCFLFYFIHSLYFICSLIKQILVFFLTKMKVLFMFLILESRSTLSCSIDISLV